MSNHNAKYSFYYLLSLVALIFSAISLGLILFGVIDKSVADAFVQDYYRNLDGQFKFAISALLIASPIYYLSVSLINKGLKREELSMESPLRRWLTYLIIFVNALIILGVFIGIFYNFLSGALTARFLLKLLSVLLIASVIFSYYFYDIRRKVIEGKDKLNRYFGIISGILVILVFISAWFFVEMPADARAKRLDQNLMNHIYQIENAVNNYYALYNRLPLDLEELQADREIYLEKRYLSDPETSRLIEYRIEEDNGFSLCAEFRRDSEEFNNDRPVYGRGSDKSYRAGYSCIEGELWSKLAPGTDIKPLLVE